MSELKRLNTAKKREFVSAMIAESLLEDAIQWIASEFSPEDVFFLDVLKEWARDNGIEVVELEVAKVLDNGDVEGVACDGTKETEHGKRAARRSGGTDC